MENHFKRVHAPMDLIISGVILIAGIGLFFVSKGFGIAVGLCGVLTFLFYKSGWRRIGDDTPLKHRSVQVSRNCKSSISDFLEGKIEDVNLLMGNEGGTLLLKIWYPADLHKSYVQLFDYIELQFQPATEIIELNRTTTQKLMSKL